MAEIPLGPPGFEGVRGGAGSGRGEVIVRVNRGGRGTREIAPRTGRPGGSSTTILPRGFDTNLGRAAAARTLTINAALGTIPVLYGTQRIGGNLVFIQQTAVYLWAVFVLCEGPISEVSKILIDGKQIDAAAGPDGLGLVLNTDYWVYLGTSAQTVNSSLTAVNAGWVSGLPGTAYVIIRYPQPTAVTGSYDPLRFVAEIKGKTVRDPRVDLFNYVYSDNPALHLFDLLTNPTYGAGFPDAYLDSGTGGSWAVAANDCDLSLARPTAPVAAPAITENATPGGLSGAVAYTYTFTDAGGVESIESPVSSTLTPSSSLVSANVGIVVGPAGTTARTIYRTKPNDLTGARYLVAIVADNTTTTYVDSIAFGSLGVRAPQTSKRYTMGLMLRDGAPLTQWIETIRAHFMGYLNYDGTYHLNVDKAKIASGIRFSDQGLDANIIDLPVIRSKGAAEVPTKVIATFTDQNNDYADATAEREIATVATRADERRELRLNLPGVLSFDQASRIALQHLNAAILRDKSIEWYATPEGLQPIPGDIVSVTSQIGISNAPVVVLDCEPMNDGMRWRLRGEFYDPAVYSDTVQNNPHPISPGLFPPTPGAVTGLADASVAVMDSTSTPTHQIWNSVLAVTFAPLGALNVIRYRGRLGGLGDTWATMTDERVTPADYQANDGLARISFDPFISLTVTSDWSVATAGVSDIAGAVSTELFPYKVIVRAELGDGTLGPEASITQSHFSMFDPGSGVDGGLNAYRYRDLIVDTLGHVVLVVGGEPTYTLRSLE